MSGIHLSPRHARFDPGYNVWGWIPGWVGWPFAKRSARLRRFVIELPPSRFRMAWLARYYWAIVDEMRRASFDGFVPAVHPNAELDLFGLGTYVGGQAWGQALTEFMDSFEELHFELREFIDVDGSRFLSMIEGTGTGSTSGIELQAEVIALEVRTRDGMAIYGRLYQGKEDAMNAVGLSK